MYRNYLDFHKKHFSFIFAVDYVTKTYEILFKVNSKMYTKTLLWIQNMKNHHMIMTIILHKTAFVIAMNTYPYV